MLQAKPDIKQSALIALHIFVTVFLLAEQVLSRTRAVF